MGAWAKSSVVARALILSESRVVDLLFLVFLLRINFDKMRHFYAFGEALLRLGI
jgi:hypothetical protein